MYKSVYEDVWEEVQDAFSEMSGSTVGDAVMMVMVNEVRNLNKEIKNLRVDLKRMEARNRELNRIGRNR